jgi:hypothetical protein
VACLQHLAQDARLQVQRTAHRSTTAGRNQCYWWPHCCNVWQ